MAKSTKRAMRRPGTKYVGVDLDSVVVDRLSEIAQQDKRTLTSLLRVIVHQWLAEYDKPGATGPTGAIGVSGATGPLRISPEKDTGQPK